MSDSKVDFDQDLQRVEFIEGFKVGWRTGVSRAMNQFLPQGHSSAWVLGWYHGFNLGWSKFADDSLRAPPPAVSPTVAPVVRTASGQPTLTEREQELFRMLEESVQRREEIFTAFAGNAKLCTEQLEQAHKYGNEQAALREAAEAEVVRLRGLLEQGADAEETYVEAMIGAWLAKSTSKRLPDHITTAYIIESALKLTPSEAVRSPAIAQAVAAAMRRQGFERVRIARGGLRSYEWQVSTKSKTARKKMSQS